MITHENTVFLGCVVNPKTLEPVWVMRRSASYRTVSLLYRGQYHLYTSVGEGYLDGGDMGAEYTIPVDITGFPRSHTPDGVKVQGAGFGTCLYTGLVLLASAIQDDELQPQARHAAVMPGRGYGICSDEESRSMAATRWWRQALHLGLTQQEVGEVEKEVETDETDTETREDEDLTDYMGTRRERAIMDDIRDAVNSDGEWAATHISIRGDVEREVPRESETDEVSVTADYYTLSSATKHRLVALRQTFDGDLMAWGKSPSMDGTFVKEVILALKVSNDDPILVGKLAACARDAGATEAETMGMVLRNRYGLDALRGAIGHRTAEDLQIGTMIGDPRFLIPNPRQGRVRRRLPARELPALRNPAPLPIPSRADQLILDRDAEALQRRRQQLGWSTLKDLP